MTSPFIDFHTHKMKPQSHDLIQVINLFPEKIEATGYFTMGIHPWYIQKDNIEEWIYIIEHNILKNSILFIGECGLDKINGPDLKLQESVFEKQIQLSKKYNLPLVVHCVKAYNEIILKKESFDSIQPWILHGYKGSIQLTKQLVAAGFYFSVHLAEDISVKMQESLKFIPIEKIFFETDDLETDIRECYYIYSELMKIELNQLKKKLKENFERIR